MIPIEYEHLTLYNGKEALKAIYDPTVYWERFSRLAIISKSEGERRSNLLSVYYSTGTDPEDAPEEALRFASMPHIHFNNDDFDIFNPLLQQMLIDNPKYLDAFVIGHKKGRSYFGEHYYLKQPTPEQVKTILQKYNSEFKLEIGRCYGLLHDEIMNDAGFRNGILDAYAEFEDIYQPVFDAVLKDNLEKSTSLEKKPAGENGNNLLIDGAKVLKVHEAYEGILWGPGISEQEFLGFWIAGTKENYLPLLKNKQTSFLYLLCLLGLKPDQHRRGGVPYKVLEQTFGLKEVNSRMNKLKGSQKYPEVTRIFSERKLNKA